MTTNAKNAKELLEEIKETIEYDLGDEVFDAYSQEFGPITSIDVITDLEQHTCNIFYRIGGHPQPHKHLALVKPTEEEMIKIKMFANLMKKYRSVLEERKQAIQDEMLKNMEMDSVLGEEKEDANPN